MNQKTCFLHKNFDQMQGISAGLVFLWTGRFGLKTFFFLIPISDNKKFQQMSKKFSRHRVVITEIHRRSYMKKFIKLAGCLFVFLMVGAPFAVHASCKGTEHCFVPDVGSVLSFTNAFEPGGALPAGSTLIPFVVAPNEMVVQGTPLVADGILTDFSFSPIVVANPVFGIYHIGVQVTLAADFSPGLINLTSQVTSDRAGPAPTKITVVSEEDTISPVFPLLTGNQYQTIADFTYGQGNIP